MNAERIKAILNDEDFNALAAAIRTKLTTRVMSKKTTEEDRAEALLKFHALDNLFAMMRSEAQNVED